MKLVGVFWDSKERKGTEVPLEFVWHVLCLQFHPQVSAKVYMHPVKIVCLKCSQHKPAMCVYLTLNEAKDFIRKKNLKKIGRLFQFLCSGSKGIYWRNQLVS